MKLLVKSLFKHTVFVFLLSSLALAQTINLKIIETSDVHGAIVPYDLIKDTITSSSLPQVHSFWAVRAGHSNNEWIHSG